MLSPNEPTVDTANSGLAILFAAIDYHQSTKSSSLISPASSITKSRASSKSNRATVNPFRSRMDQRMRRFIEARAVNPRMLDEEALMVGFAFPQRGANVDIKWIDEGSLSLRQRKMNRRSLKRFHSRNTRQTRQSKKVSAAMALSIPLPDSLTVVESSPVIVHATVSPSSSVGSASSAFDDHLSIDDGPTIIPVDETSHQDSSYENVATTRRISIDSDGFDALLKKQQQRLFFMSQKTKKSRALLQRMMKSL